MEKNQSAQKQFPKQHARVGEIKEEILARYKKMVDNIRLENLFL